jgi:F5/8 type C domain
VRGEGRTAADVLPTGSLRLGRALAVLGTYVVIAAIYTHPVLLKSATGIANDPYDPILNTSILWWNATTIPFSPGWWNPPHFHPSQGVAGFTENLVGVSVFATPIYWLTGNALAAYNITFVLSWPFCAFTTYLLVWFLVRRHDAAFLAGLAYGFTPYRTAELGHLQMLSVYWFPLTLLGLHGFLLQRRGRWLILFGAAWVVQVLANGYYLFFGGVLVAAWILYFAARPAQWRALPAILGSWALANLPLAPILWKYSTIHEQYGLHRTMAEALAFSARVSAWIDVSQVVWFWHKLLPESKDNLFPGLTMVLLAAAGSVKAFDLARRSAPPVDRRRRTLIAVFASVLTVCAAVLIAVVLWGPFSGTVLGIPMRIKGLTRTVNIALVSAAVLVWLVKPLRAAVARRSTLVFYVAMTIVLGVLCCGPQLQRADGEMFGRMPYRWLMYLPGFESVRVPTRFWMLGTLCLAIAAGISFARYGPSRRTARQMLFAVAIAGILLDGWTRGLDMPNAPVQWPKVERRDRVEAVIELPLGPSWDAAATFRAMRHRRPVVNGVSGYDPPHYAPLQDGLNAFEPSVLVALSAFGPLDVVVNGDSDPDGIWARYAASVAGDPILTDGTRRVYRVPSTPATMPPALGPILPIVSISASSRGADVVNDNDVTTEWHDEPQQLPGHWLTADIGSVREIAGVTLTLGEWVRDFPRRLAIETSIDGATWQTVWEANTVGLAVLAAIERPRESPMRFSFAPRAARFVRLRTLVEHKNLWRVAELRVHGPVVSH